MLLVAIACAAAAYFVANWIGDTLIEKVYLDQKAMQKRERAIVSELQTYVQENRISSRDTDAVARWSMSKSDTYVMLYRNQRLAFEAGWWGVDDVDETDAPPLLSNSAGVYPIYFTDGPMQAVVYDFSESRLYTLTTIVSVLVGCFVLMCFMLSYNGRITRTIVTIAAEVEQIGRGDLTARLEKPRGNDELAGLTESVERMRASLLHKTEEEQKAYVEVLSRQSQRLKKLIDDLMEMSKASTGNIQVDIGEIDAVEAVTQALGEFADKLTAAGLTPVFHQSEENIMLLADGRLLWRAMSNVLSNAVKYALPGTRLYVDVSATQDKAIISFKNISGAQLNISAEELMERFVRGDSSRNTEGSGLGLNIAKSLMELQKGQLQLLVDGDLFKVTLVFPRAI